MSCAVAKALALVGVSQTLIARCLGIAPSTLCLWKALYPEFLNALKQGENAAIAARAKLTVRCLGGSRCRD